jgi:cytosine/adenosine deaminase-related metal-dependent hydrolase
MQLSDVTIVGQSGLKCIYIENGKIVTVADAGAFIPKAGETLFFANDAIAFPGLINSHDHLDFNLFSRLGNSIYKSYAEWGSDIHRHNRESISPVLNIPRHLRTQWGIYKNLLNGITTVVNHGPELEIREVLISVCQETHSFHSLSGEKGWRLKLLNPFKQTQPVVIHIGEGTTAAAAAEIGKLVKWNILKRQIIAIHGIAMHEKEAPLFRALVWCPDSNCFLYNKTAAIDRLKHKIQVVFGTDSTLTASWNLWEQLRLARDLKLTADEELWEMLTHTPAGLWNLEGCGSIAKGQRADITIARPSSRLKGWDVIYALNPENILLVVHKGNIRLFDQSLYDQLARFSLPLHDFYKVQVGEAVKYIQGNLPDLMDTIRTYHPSVEFPVIAPASR